MGNFLTNYQIRAASVEDVAVAAQEVVAGAAAASPSRNGWITLYDETSELQDPEEIRRVAQSISLKLTTVVFGFMVHDSDVLIYFLYVSGSLRDEFNSQPDYFEEIDDQTWMRTAGHVDAILPYCPQPGGKESIAGLLDRVRRRDPKAEGKTKPYSNAVERLLRFGAVLGLDEQLIALGYNDYQEMRKETIVLQRGFKRIKGKGKSAAELRPKTFIDLIRQGDVEGVRRSLEEGADPNQMLMPQQYSAIALAADAIQPEIVRLLLEAGADPNAGEMTALGAATARGLKEVIPQLFNAGVDPNKGDIDPVLCAVVFHDDPELLQMLIEGGASVLGRPGERSPLSVARAFGARRKKEITDLLLAAGAGKSEETGRDQ